MRKLKVTELHRISTEEFKEAEKLPLVVVLDNVRSLHNIGSVFRTSDAFRISCIYLCGITACPPNPEMHKTALGAEYSVDWKHVDSTLEAVESLKSEGYTVYSVEQVEGSVMLENLQLERGRKYAVILGNSDDRTDFIEQSSGKMAEEYIPIFQKQTSFPAVNIGHLAVREDMQSKGIGRKVLDFVLGTFIDYDVSGCQFITVDSLNNPRTNNFYLRNGFINQTDMDMHESTRRMFLPIELYRDDNIEDEEDV